MRRLVVLVLLLASCTGDQGPVGPAGEDGVDGRDGAVNATIITIDVASGDFSVGDGVELAQYTIPEITGEIVDGGLVLAFIDLIGRSQSEWWQMPITLATQAGTASFQHSFAFRTLYVSVFSSGGPVGGVLDGTHIRIIIIPPGESASEAELNNLLAR